MSTPAKVAAFLPDAQEILEEKLPRFIRFGVWFPLVAVVLAIAWASLAKTEIVLACDARTVRSGGAIALAAEIRPDDIARVKVGSVARVKLSAYPFQRYGTLAGTVTNLADGVGERYVGGRLVRSRRADLALSGALRTAEGEVRLIPGLDARCEIVCGRRRVVEYVLYPLLKAFDEVAREP